MQILSSGARPDFAKEYAELCAEDTAMGFSPHKYAKLREKIKGVLRGMLGKKSVGVVCDDEQTGIMKIAKPIGIIGALLPVTNGEATPFIKALHALKTRNAIILAPPIPGPKRQTISPSHRRGQP